ncbi:hypothetical protein SUDANB145_06385 [Streptomyces sp. enrichment culture]
MLREQAARTPEGQWVRVVGGWSAEQSAERRLPTVAELNAAAPDTPVFVLHPYRSAILNRAALRAVGCDRPPAGRSCGTGRRTHGHAPGRPERPDPVLGPGQGAGAGPVVRPEDGDGWLRPDGAGESLTWAAADFENFAQPRPAHAPDYEVEFERAVRLLMENGWGFRLHASVSSSVAGADQDSGVPHFESTARVGTVRTPTTCLVPSFRGNASRNNPDHFIFTLISRVVTHQRKGNYLTSGHAHRGGGHPVEGTCPSRRAPFRFCGVPVDDGRRDCTSAPCPARLRSGHPSCSRNGRRRLRNTVAARTEQERQRPLHMIHRSWISCGPDPR